MKQRTVTILKDPTITCPCVAEHSPKLIEVHEHHIVPLYAGGPDTPSNIIRVCPNTHYATHALLRQYERHQGTPPWSIRRQFPRYAQELAQMGWERRTPAQQQKMDPG